MRRLILVMAMVLPSAAMAAPAPARGQKKQKEQPALRVAAPLPGERQFLECLELPPSRPVRLHLKPETDMSEVVGWIASITCKGFIVQSGLNLASRLEIDQEMSEIASDSFSALGPSTTRRTAQTTVFARDQQTIIIGGLMRDKVTSGVQKVPFLGDIPLLGFFFRSTTKSVEKQNIILAITPYVIDDPSDLVRVLAAKVRDRRDFLRHFGSDHERRLLLGPLGLSGSGGMLEQINRATRAPVEEVPPPASPGAAAALDGVALPGS
jgi:hypothetical protein